ncbi:unnamed protein product [Psylliodes chrysocephalus]|uniref:Uncharacterized protein n=1 Tax=Psylliodes chrysocephalus TaxID=3402493 RepID=A0A9P0G3C6_9CUCU|nr:unnamed protein product [Psylliodes chrysocephala]
MSNGTGREKRKTKWIFVKIFKTHSNPTPSPSNAKPLPEPIVPMSELDPLIIDDQQPSTSTDHDHISEVSSDGSDGDKNKDAALTVDIDDFDPVDPATWHTLVIHRLIEIIVLKDVVQIKENFPVDETGKKFSAKQYMRTLANFEKVDRDWLVYSTKINAIFL